MDIGKRNGYLKTFLYFPMIIIKKRRGRYGTTVKSQRIPIAVWYQKEISGFYNWDSSMSTISMAIWGLYINQQPDKKS